MTEETCFIVVDLACVTSIVDREENSSSEDMKKELEDEASKRVLKLKKAFFELYQKLKSADRSSMICLSIEEKIK